MAIYEKLIGNGNFDINKVLKIMEFIDHKWVIPAKDEEHETEYRVPTFDEVLFTIDFLVEKIKESFEFIHGVTDTPIESCIGGIHLRCTMSSKPMNEDWPKRPLEYRWEIWYAPVSTIVHE